MKAIVFYDVGDIRIEDLEIPKIGEHEALLKVRAAAVCATDLRVIQNGHRKIPKGEKRILGHEIAGEIVKVGRFVKNLMVGDRVAIAPVVGCGYCKQCLTGKATSCKNDEILGLSLNGGFSEFMKIPESHIRCGNVFKIPENISFDIASISEALATVFTGLEACNLKPADIVLIIGAGPIGIMNTLLSKVYGAQLIIVSEILKERRDRVLAFGADHVIDPINEKLADKVLELSYGRGADVVIVAAASPEAQIQSIDCSAIGGYINFFGTLPKGKEKIVIDSNIIHYKNIKIFGTTGTTVINYYKVLELLITGKLNISNLISHRYKLSDFKEAFKAARDPNSLKVVFEF